MNHNKRLFAIILTVIGCLLWFQPFSAGVISKTGVYYGNLAYGLLVLPVAFTLSVWIKQKALSYVFAVLYVLLSSYYMVDIGLERLGLGLIGIGVCSVAAIYVAAMKK